MLEKLLKWLRDNNYKVIESYDKVNKLWIIIDENFDIIVSCEKKSYSITFMHKNTTFGLSLDAMKILNAIYALQVENK